jgi:hypothetical protein
MIVVERDIQYTSLKASIDDGLIMSKIEMIFPPNEVRFVRNQALDDLAHIFADTSLAEEL